MKNDSTTTFLNFVLAALIILGVVFALFSIWRTRDFRQLQTRVQLEMQKYNMASMKAQAILNETITYNATAKNPELAQIIQSVTVTPSAPK
jgi:hypothetical protein